jgi:hypothetical protein
VASDYRTLICHLPGNHCWNTVKRKYRVVYVTDGNQRDQINLGGQKMTKLLPCDHGTRYFLFKTLLSHCFLISTQRNCYPKEFTWLLIALLHWLFFVFSCLFLFSPTVLGFKLKASVLLSRHSTTWANL